MKFAHIVLVGGMGRSGTSILKNTLANHSGGQDSGSEMSWLSAPGGLFHFSSQIRHCYTPFVVDKAWKEFKHLLTGPETRSKYLGLFGEEYGLKSLDRLKLALFDEMTGSKYHYMEEEDHFYEIFAGHVYNSLYQWGLANFMYDLIRHRAEELNLAPTFWVDDTIENVWWFEEARNIFPSAILIHAVRHPYDIVAGIKTRQDGSPSKWWWPIEPMDIAQRIHNLWKATSRMRPFFHQVRLEELVDHPRASLGAILEDIGITWEEGMDRYIDPMQHHRHRWQEELTEHDLAVIQPILEPVVRSWGYVDN